MDLPTVYLTETNEIFGNTYSISEITEVATAYCFHSLKELIDS